MRKSALFCLMLTSTLAETACRNPSSSAVPNIEAGKYYAVLLSNGSVYFGKLEGLGTSYPC
jgi:hypothetical protein